MYVRVCGSVGIIWNVDIYDWLYNSSPELKLPEDLT